MEGAEKEVGRTLQLLARHRMIERLYQDILVDLVVCDIEGWDKMEYILQLRNLLDTLGGEHVAKTVDEGNPGRV